MCDSYITILSWNLRRWRCQTIERQRWREAVMSNDLRRWRLRTIEKNRGLGLVEQCEKGTIGTIEKRERLETVRKGNDWNDWCNSEKRERWEKGLAGIIVREDKGKRVLREGKRKGMAYSYIFFSKSFLNGFKRFNIIWTQKLSLHPPF